MTTSAALKKFLPERMLNVLGKNLPAIIGSLDSSHETAEQIIQACIDQLFLTTASGKYLLQLAEQQGFAMPANSGLDIRSYKVLVPVMVANPKQVRITIDELIQAFYGSDKLKPSITSSVYGAVSLADGDYITIETDGGTESIFITESQVSNISNVSAEELAAIINSSQTLFLASTDTDRSTGLTALKISSATVGLNAYIKIVGGTLQNILKFPNVLDTLNDLSTTWNVTKEASYSTDIKFQWNGIGTNPNIYITSKDDIVTIRGLVDGAQPFSLLNGSYKIVDSGYDYFIIRNEVFSALSSSFTQPADNSIVFTSSVKITLYDKDEYAFSNETSNNTISVTVPAVPPLTRRFLSGSAHLHGNEHFIVDFTRNSVKISVPSNQEVPVQSNKFVIKNDIQSYDFVKRKYKTISVDTSLTTPNYILNTSDSNYSIFPYTVVTLIGNNPIFGSIDSDIFKIEFPFDHGLEYRWQFTLGSGTGVGNILSGDLNGEHYVYKVVDRNTIEFRIENGSGSSAIFGGIAWSGADIYRHSSLQSDGSDFYLQFASPAAAIASGLTAGISFKLDTVGGTDVIPYLGNYLRTRNLVVKSVSGDKVNFSSGLGVGFGGLSITGISGKRSGYFGGNTITYFFDKTSTYNSEVILGDMKLLMLDYTPSQNSEYVGSFLYDPNGVKTTVTISKYITKLSDNILKGANIPALFVDNLVIDGEDFPQNGEIIIDYGTSKEEGPIRYNATIDNLSSKQILIDPAYKFKNSHSEGAQIFFIHEKTAYVPLTDGSDYSVYLTGTSSARNTLFSLIELLVAAGIFIETTVILPELRYVDEMLDPYS
jgi:hypothetical protein